MAASEVGTDLARRPAGRSRLGQASRRLHALTGSLLHRTVLVFVVAYVLIVPAVYLVYWDQVRAYRTTVLAANAGAVRTDVLRMALGAADQRWALDRVQAAPYPGFVPDYANGLAEVAAGSRALAADAAGTGIDRSVSPMQQAVDAWLAWAGARWLDAEGGRPPAIDVAVAQRGRDLYDALLHRADELDRVAAGRTAVLEAASDSQQQAAIRDNLLVTAVVIVIVSVVVASLLGSILRSMGRLARTAHRLSEGEEVPVPYADRHDEVGQLARALANWQGAELVRRAAVEEREILHEQAPVGLSRLDQEGRLVTVNRTLQTMLGRPAAQLVGRTHVEFMHPDDRDRDADAHAALREGRLERLATENRYLRPDGTVVWCATVTSPLHGVDGRPGGFVAIVEDISERRQQAERAAHIQRQLLPQGTPEIDGFDLAAVCVPAQDVAGDFYDWTVQDHGTVELTVADVMGKGVGAALVMAVLRTALRSAPADLDPATQVGLAASSMNLGADDEGLFVTLFHAHLDVGTGMLRYVDAGHGYCEIRRATGELEPLTVRSLPVGVSSEETFLEGTVVLEPADSLIVYSDGLVETEERTISLAQLTAGFNGVASSAEMVRHLMSTTADRPADDVTVLVLRRLAGTAVPHGTLHEVAGGLALELEAAAPGNQLDLIHDALARFWESLRPAPADEWRMLFELAVAEVAANVIEHARPALMSLRLSAGDGHAVAEFSYAGAGWTDSPPTALPDAMAERGRGLFLARTGVDDVRYHRSGATVRWRLLKRL
jgi:PAS domain S-box-containing protein